MATMIQFKFQLNDNGELRRFALEQDACTIANIQSKIAELTAAKKVALQWVDEDSDIVKIGSDAELGLCIRSQLETSTVVRLRLSETVQVDTSNVVRWRTSETKLFESEPAKSEDKPAPETSEAHSVEREARKVENEARKVEKQAEKLAQRTARLEAKVQHKAEKLQRLQERLAARQHPRPKMRAMLTLRAVGPAPKNGGPGPKHGGPGPKHGPGPKQGQSGHPHRRAHGAMWNSQNWHNRGAIQLVHLNAIPDDVNNNNDTKQEIRPMEKLVDSETREPAQVVRPLVALEKPNPRLRARFVADVNCPQGTEYAPGTEFTKTWRFRNETQTAWPEGTSLVFVSRRGDRLGAEPIVALPAGLGKPGQEADVSINCIAPEEAGDYCGFWRLAEPDGRKFGQRVQVSIRVAGSSSDTSTSDEESSDTTSGSWGQKLHELEAMGFANRRANIRLLVKFSGDMEKVVLRLLHRAEKKAAVKGRRH